MRIRLRRLGLGVLYHCRPKSYWVKISDAYQWVFVTGCNRSGKTTLSNLFANHPDVSVIPNGNSHTKGLPSSDTERCPHIWTEKFDFFRLTEGSDHTRADRLAFDWLHYSRDPRRIILVESDLSAIQMRWLQKVFRNAYFVGLVRNGYAVAEGIRLKEGYSIERCARQWKIANKVMLADAKLVKNFKLVRYEDFVANPMRVIKDLAMFVDIDPAPLRPFVLNGWRLGNTNSKPSKLRNANPESIKRLSSEDIETITANAWEMLDCLGYLLPERAHLDFGYG